MKVLIVNGAMERKENATSVRLAAHLSGILNAKKVEVQVFNLANSGIPLFDTEISGVPDSVDQMNLTFREADLHIWLTPLYHGSMTGAMKNCLDWLECSAGLPKPYLTGKRISLICWADGVQALQGINSMDAVAKSLRAWVSPYNVPIKRSDLFGADDAITPDYQQRLELMADVLVTGPDH